MQHPSLQVSKRWAMEYALLQWLGVDAVEPALKHPSAQPLGVVLHEFD